MSERLVGEIAFDPAFRDLYLGVRGEEGHTGIVIAFAPDAEYVHAALKRDQKIERPRTKYFFFKPASKDDIRESWTIGGEE